MQQASHEDGKKCKQMLKCKQRQNKTNRNLTYVFTSVSMFDDLTQTSSDPVYIA